MVTSTCCVVWNIAAEYPGAEPREIIGLKSKADVDDWMNGDRSVFGCSCGLRPPVEGSALGDTRRVAWLRAQGYAK
jgi:hypothetical protein